MLLRILWSISPMLWSIERPEGCHRKDIGKSHCCIFVCLLLTIHGGAGHWIESCCSAKGFELVLGGRRGRWSGPSRNLLNVWLHEVPIESFTHNLSAPPVMETRVRRKIPRNALAGGLQGKTRHGRHFIEMTQTKPHLVLFVDAIPLSWSTVGDWSQGLIYWFFT